METKFKVGDKVKAFGNEGVIDYIDYIHSCNAFPIHVTFKHDLGDFVEYFTADGRSSTRHKEPVLTLIERPKTKKRVMMYPALMNDPEGGFCISRVLFRNIEEAKTRSNSVVRLLTDRGVFVEFEE